ncbi:MAG: hypothetical protein GAK28_02201 [Luteibacter sp.]|uniref:hypothetical protein n=1 Tax=Luteibacter sp. TaxID=1886636 RepID=UPI001383FC6C|nr:hypothetical protein [Luteibacter sp.]KAF1006882.1 MAG: hypothetical protein GAK28_02201 [Luteibacter sp.]
MKKLIVGTVLALVSTASFAQYQTPPARITQIVTGWASDSFSLNMGAPAYNPAGCQATDIYASDISNPGYKTFYAAALTAFATDTPVVLVVSTTECQGARPKLMSVTLTH